MVEALTWASVLKVPLNGRLHSSEVSSEGDSVVEALGTKREDLMVSRLAVLGMVAALGLVLAGSAWSAVREPVLVPGGRCEAQAKALVRPGGFTLRCGQWDYFFTGLEWRSWGGSVAEGTGVVHANLCLPANGGCAGGKYRLYKAVVELSRPIACSRSRTYPALAPGFSLAWRFLPHFTLLSWRFVGSKPPKWDRHITLSFFACE
jgi:hypothetical protein